MKTIIILAALAAAVVPASAQTSQSNYEREMQRAQEANERQYERLRQQSDQAYQDSLRQSEAQRAEQRHQEIMRELRR